MGKRMRAVGVKPKLSAKLNNDGISYSLQLEQLF
jgi:hypothetical protein